MGTKNQRVVYEWVIISDDLAYEWVRFFKVQVYEWGRFQNTGSHTRTKITHKLPPPPPTHTHTTRVDDRHAHHHRCCSYRKGWL